MRMDLQPAKASVFGPGFGLGLTTLGMTALSMVAGLSAADASAATVRYTPFNPPLLQQPIDILASGITVTYDVDEQTEIGTLTLSGARLVTNIDYSAPLYNSPNTFAVPGGGIAGPLPIVSLTVTIDAANDKVIDGLLTVTTTGTVDTPNGTVGPGTLLEGDLISGIAAYGSSIDIIFSDPDNGLLASLFVADGPFIGMKINNSGYNGDGFDSDFASDPFAANTDIFATPVPAPTAAAGGLALAGLLARRRRTL